VRRHALVPEERYQVREFGQHPLENHREADEGRVIPAYPRQNGAVRRTVERFDADADAARREIRRDVTEAEVLLFLATDQQYVATVFFNFCHR
jgi:hypothetical protein